MTTARSSGRWRRRASSFPVAESVEEPCAGCGTPKQQNFQMFGPEAFDCHGNLFVGAGGAVVEMLALPAVNDCPSRLSQLAQLTLAPSISLVPARRRGKKAKALDFQAGCTGPGCSISVLAQARLPHCNRANCTIVLAHGRFKLKPGAHTLALTLTHGNEALLGANPRLPIQLSARLLRDGHPFGRVVRANGGQAAARPALRADEPLLSRPGFARRAGDPFGEPRPRRAHTRSASRSDRPAATRRCRSTRTARAPSPRRSAATSLGPWTFVATYAGDRLHAASGAGCGTYVLPGPPPPSHKKGPPPPPPPPVETKLELACRAKGTEEPFTGKISPALAEVPITITYKYKSPGWAAHRKGRPGENQLRRYVQRPAAGRNQRRPGRHRPGALAGRDGLPRSDLAELRIRALRGRPARPAHHSTGSRLALSLRRHVQVRQQRRREIIEARSGFGEYRPVGERPRQHAVARGLDHLGEPAHVDPE